MATAEVNGATIAYDDTGGGGPPVVLAHGFLMDRSMFDAQVAALRDRYRVITWDGRGFGDTVYHGEPFTYWDLAADCLGLLDHLGIDRAVLGGMSQGGFVALRAALLSPERVRGLILLATQAGPEDAEVIPLYQAMLDEWVDDGPTDALAGATASLIIGDPDLSATWAAVWKSRPQESLRNPGRTLLEREPDPRDRRRTLVWLTPVGFTALEQDREVLSGELLTQAVAAMAPEDRRALLHGVTALLDADDRADGHRDEQQRIDEHERIDEHGHRDEHLDEHGREATR